jgi:hypothetical protein
MAARHVRCHHRANEGHMDCIQYVVCLWVGPIRDVIGFGVLCQQTDLVQQ